MTCLCGSPIPVSRKKWCSRKCSNDARQEIYRKTPKYKATRRAYRRRQEVKAKELAYAEAYRARPEVREHRAAYMTAYWKDYRERPGVSDHRRMVSVRYRQRPDIAALLKTRKKEYRSKPENRVRQMDYFADYVVQVNGLYFNRKKDPPEIVAIAERIKETKTLLREKT